MISKRSWVWGLTLILSLSGSCLFLQGLGWAADEANQLFADAKTLLEGGKTEEAKGKLTEYVKKYSRSAHAPEAQYLLGSLEEDFVSAVHGLRNTVRNYKGTPWAKKAQFELAFLYFMRENYSQAATEFRTFLAAYPTDKRVPETQYWLGMSFLRAGSLLDAQRQLEEAWELGRETQWTGQIAVALCQVLLENKQYVESINIGETALNLEMAPAFSDLVRETLRECYTKLGINQISQGASSEAPSFMERMDESVGTHPLEDFPFAIQVGAFTKKKWAQNVEKQLQSRGYDSYTVDGSLDGKPVYKVRVGRFRTQQEAERMAEQIMVRENFKTYVVRE